MCGEHIDCIVRIIFVMGSSPHVRGALSEPTINQDDAGIIPACAGSTGRTWLSDGRRRDHPRMCGEHMPFRLLALLEPGSSPHVRGARS